MIDLHKMVWAYEAAKKQLEYLKTKKGNWMHIQTFRAIVDGYETKLKELTNAAV